MTQATSFASIMSDTDRHKLKELSLSLYKKEQELSNYKDTLANVLRRSHDLISIIQKLHRRTGQEISDCEKIISDISGILREVKLSTDDKII